MFLRHSLINSGRDFWQDVSINARYETKEFGVEQPVSLGLVHTGMNISLGLVHAVMNIKTKSYYFFCKSAEYMV